VISHGDNRGVLAEALVSWASLYGVATAMRVYWKQTARSRVERCVLFLLGVLFGLLAVRGFFWITGSKVFGALTYFFASVLPLAVVLYIEALLRRHMPLLVKILVLAGTVVFVAFALSERLHADPFWMRVFSGYVLALMVVLLTMLFLRDRSDLTEVENRAADAVGVAVAMIVPFVMTDLLTDLGLPMVRVGSVGILMFAFATVVAAEPRATVGAVVNTHLRVIGLSIALGAIEAWVIGDVRTATVARTGAFFACFLLLTMIYLRVHTHRQLSRGPGLVRSIATADTRTTEGFLHVLEQLPIVADYRLVRAADLRGYDHKDAFVGLFPADGARVVTRRQLRRRSGAPQVEHSYVADQLADLLEREQMTHAVLLRERPLSLLLVHIPSAGLEQSAIAQLGLVRAVAAVIERGHDA